MDLTNTHSTDDLEQKGRRLYSNNSTYRRMANVMEHPEFREFFNTYMTDWETAKNIIMFMKLYEAIEKHSKLELTPYQKIAIADDFFQNSNKRQQICSALKEWCNNSRLPRISTLETPDEN